MGIRLSKASYTVWNNAIYANLEGHECELDISVTDDFTGSVEEWFDMLETAFVYELKKDGLTISSGEIQERGEYEAI